MSDAPTSDLTGWRSAPFTGAGLTYDCYEKGAGPGVVLVPEIPGITPEVLGLADHLVDQGFTVVVPSPFGTPGRPMTAGYVLGIVARLCVAAEFKAFAVNAERPITQYLRAVARDLAGRTPGKGVGVIGMCFTGGFALAAAVEDVGAGAGDEPAVGAVPARHGPPSRPVALLERGVAVEGGRAQTGYGQLRSARSWSPASALVGATYSTRARSSSASAASAGSW